MEPYGVLGGEEVVDWPLSKGIVECILSFRRLPVESRLNRSAGGGVFSWASYYYDVIEYELRNPRIKPKDPRETAAVICVQHFALIGMPSSWKALLK